MSSHPLSMQRALRSVHPYLFAGVAFLTMWVIILTGLYADKMAFVRKQKALMDAAQVESAEPGHVADPGAAPARNQGVIPDKLESRKVLFIMAVHSIWSLVIYVYAFEFGVSETYRHQVIDANLRRLEGKVRDLTGHDASCTFSIDSHVALIRVWDVPDDIREDVEDCIYDNESAIMPRADWRAQVIVYSHRDTAAFQRMNEEQEAKAL